MNRFLSIILFTLPFTLPFTILSGQVKKELTKKEVRAGMKRFNHYASKPWAKPFIKGIDADRNQHITIQEIRIYAERELPAKATSRNDLALRITHKENPSIDTNQNGILTKKELISFLKRLEKYD